MESTSTPDDLTRIGLHSCAHWNESDSPCFEKNWGFFGDGDDFNFGDFLGFHPRRSPKKIGEILGTRIACNLGIFGFFPRKTPIFGDSPKIPVLMNTKCSSMLFRRIHGCSLCKGITTCTEILGMEESLCS